MILPPGHWQAVAAPRQLRSREKGIIAAILGLLVAGLVVLAISLVSTGNSSGNGCVHVTAAYVTGGTELYRCGAEARALCSSTAGPGATSTALGRAVASECRKAGLSASR